MKQITIKTNAAEVDRWLLGAGKKVRQAGATALAKTALQIQHAERIELNRIFTIRKAAFMRNRIKIYKFPKWNAAGGMEAILGVDDKVRGSKLLLSTFEGGGQKSPASGSRVAIPLTGGKARPAFRKGVPAAYRLDRLGLHTNIKTGIVQGQKRTFILPTKRGEYALFQRGPGGRSTGPDMNMSPLYIFRNRVTLKNKFKFLRIATQLAEEQLPKLYNRYLRLYIRG